MPIAEGGGPRPPYHESFLENIVNVHWQSVGGIFVSGDECCWERYTRYPDNKKILPWLPLGAMSFTSGGTTIASAYAKTNGGPVFLLGGTAATGGATIMRSADGYTWTTPFGHVHGVFDNVSALVWDHEENKFFAMIDDKTAYSPNGISWFFSGDNFFDHCKGIIPNTPMGVYGYDSSSDMIIYPDSEGNAVAVVNASFMDAEEFTIWTGVPYVSCVAYAGGIWHTGGGEEHFITSRTTTSINGGEDWFFSSVGDLGMGGGDYAVLTMIGAPIQDIKSSSKDPKVSSPGFKPTPVTMVARQANAGRSQQSQRGIMAAAISPPRAPRTRLRRPARTI
jgi:hypothetical protein